MAVWRLGSSGGMRGEDAMGRDARLVTGIHVTLSEAVKGFFRSGIFRGRSYDKGGAGLDGLYMTATVYSDDRSEILRCVVKALKHSKNVVGAFGSLRRPYT